MPNQHTYVKELEELILNRLLPVYTKYQLDRGNKDPLKGVNPDLLSQIREQRRLPALLRP